MSSLKIIQQFQKEIGIERERFLQALENSRGSQNAQVKAVYRELLNNLIDEMKEENVDPADAEQWMRAEIRRAGLTWWKYEGTLIEHSRFFCQHTLNMDYVFTKAQILQMDNGYGLNPFTFRGGYNCRHSWAPGELGWPGFNNAYPEGGPFTTLQAEAGSTMTVAQG